MTESNLCLVLLVRLLVFGGWGVLGKILVTLRFTVTFIYTTYIIIIMIRPDPRLCVPFRYRFIFHGKELLAPLKTHKLEDHHCNSRMNVPDCHKQMKQERKQKV